MQHAPAGPSTTHSQVFSCAVTRHASRFTRHSKARPQSRQTVDTGGRWTGGSAVAGIYLRLVCDGVVERLAASATLCQLRVRVARRLRQSLELATALLQLLARLRQCAPQLGNLRLRGSQPAGATGLIGPQLRLSGARPLQVGLQLGLSGARPLQIRLLPGPQSRLSADTIMRQRSKLDVTVQCSVSLH